VRWFLFISKRLILLIPLLFGVTLVIFILTRVVIPGNPVDRMVPPMSSTEERQQIAERYGLNDPVAVQYVRYMRGLVRGDLGISFNTSHPVMEDLERFFPATFELTTYAMFVALLIAVPLGVAAAVRRDTWLDHMGRLNPRIAAPPRVTGLMVFDSLLAGNWVTLESSVKTLALPVLVLAFGAMAPLARMARSGMIEALDAPYITAARALGLPWRSIVFRYALKNAMLPVITMTAVVYGYLLGGSVLVENIFSWPGLGRYAYDAISGSDYPAIQGFILYAASMYVMLFIVVDVVYRLFDPRIERT
jgi:peptide/nickel transport system permease protein